MALRNLIPEDSFSLREWHGDDRVSTIDVPQEAGPCPLRVESVGLGVQNRTIA